LPGCFEHNFAINKVAAHADIYWLSACFMPENGHFSVILALWVIPKQAQTPKS
jgi:hypothetical protein